MPPIGPPPRGFYSTKDYDFREDQADAIVRVAAYHRKSHCSSVIWFSPDEHAPIRSSIATPFQRSSTTKLSHLDRLPLELRRYIMLYLDMHSLFRLRQADLRSRQTVDFLEQYQLVASHGLNLFRALLKTQLAFHVSLFDFHSALRTKACAICGEFGGFMSLLTWTRCCYKCISGDAEEVRVQSLASLRREFHLSKHEAKQLKSFKTLPGTYSMPEPPYKWKVRMTVTSVFLAKKVFDESQMSYISASFKHPAKRFNSLGSCALPYYDRQTGKIEDGVSCAGCELALERELALGSGDWVWACEARDKVYAKDGFLKHFRLCEQAQILWKEAMGVGRSG